MKSAIILLLLSIFIGQLSAQEKGHRPSVYLKWHPIMVFNPDKPYMQMSAELLFKKRWGVELGYGRRILDDWIFDGIVTDKEPDSIAVPFKGQQFLFEINLYDLLIKAAPRSSASISVRDYGGVSFRYLKDVRNQTTEFFPEDSLRISNAGIDGLLTERYAIERDLKVFTIKYGLMMEVQRLRVDGFMEWGVKINTQRYLHNELEPEGFFPFRPGIGNFPGQSVFPHLMLGIRLGYRL